MEAPLMAIAEAELDIVPLVYDRFFAKLPGEREKFLNLEAAAGRMVNETLEAMIGLSEGAYWVDTTITNFVDLHRDYGVISREVYEAFVDCVIDVIGEAAGKAWDQTSEAAWQTQAAQMKAMIAKATVGVDA